MWPNGPSGRGWGWPAKFVGQPTCNRPAQNMCRFLKLTRELGVICRDPPRPFHREKRRKSIAGCFVKRSAKLFGKGARCRQIEKAPAVINLPVSEGSTSKSQRGVVPLVKIEQFDGQFDIQSIRVDGHLDNKRSISPRWRPSYRREQMTFHASESGEYKI